jgi:hypothetical protein
MANKLERITTEYITAEDRIRLAGLTGEDLPVILWLTQRLVNRLLPPLFEWLTRQEDSFPGIESLQFVAQQQATRHKSPHPPVQSPKNRPKNLQPQAQLKNDNTRNPPPPVQVEKDSPSRLITSIDITSNDNVVSLIFKNDSEESLSLIMTASLLSQWLSILFFTYRKAEWPLTGWPDWMVEGRHAEEQPATVTVH